MRGSARSRSARSSAARPSPGRTPRRRRARARAARAPSAASVSFSITPVSSTSNQRREHCRVPGGSAAHPLDEPRAHVRIEEREARDEQRDARPARRDAHAGSASGCASTSRGGGSGAPCERRPAGLVGPRHAAGEELLGEPDSRLDEDALALRRDLRPEVEAAVAVAGLVAAVAGTRPRSGSRSRARSRSRSRGSGAPGARCFTASPISLKVSPGPVTIRRRRCGSRGSAQRPSSSRCPPGCAPRSGAPSRPCSSRPSRLPGRRARAASRRCASALGAQRGELLVGEQRQQRELDRRRTAASTGSPAGRARDAVERDRRDRPFRAAHHADAARRGGRRARAAPRARAGGRGARPPARPA